MDVSTLSVLVKKYEELYNMRHPEYFNNVKGEKVWEEIGATMKLPGGWRRVQNARSSARTPSEKCRDGRGREA
ncbi:hypothetical protein J6590_053804 [Homalodisca vitripennis]|nr:hypothetical protein J6590_053804 [Homalodisca vitripennis]